MKDKAEEKKLIADIYNITAEVASSKIKTGTLICVDK
jgi:hypothetical protein